MTPHEEAVAAIRPHIIGGGRTVEVVPSDNVFFDEFESEKMDAFNFVYGSMIGDTIIFHILVGNGLPVDDFYGIYGWAFFRYKKIIVLEHLPTCPVFVRNSSVSKERFDRVESWINRFPESVEKREILNDRNCLFVITP